MVVYLCSEASHDINGQLFHAERSMIHTYVYGEEARAIYKYTDDGMFSVDELIETIRPHRWLAFRMSPRLTSLSP